MAKDKVIELSKNYMPPSPRSDIEVLGNSGLSTLYSAINEFKLEKWSCKTPKSGNKRLS